MKWKIQPEPKDGDLRTRTKFAWFPVLVYRNAEYYQVWLETYRITEQFARTFVSSEGYYYCILKWKVIKREPLFWEHES